MIHTSDLAFVPFAALISSTEFLMSSTNTSLAKSSGVAVSASLVADAPETAVVGVRGERSKRERRGERRLLNMMNSCQKATEMGACDGRLEEETCRCGNT